MDKKHTLDILNTLASGVDPTTGEVFPDNSPYQNVEVVRALFHAAQIIDSVKDLPENAGAAWEEEEVNKVIAQFKEGVPITQIAKRHQRTSGAIRSRLKKVGAIK